MRLSDLPRLTSSVCALLTALALVPQAVADSPLTCAALTSFKAPGSDMSIKQAAVVPAAPSGVLPAYCRVDGALEERIGHDGKPYAIGFAVAMPDNWNGRFLMQGGGGLNGSLTTPLGGGP
jgi:feruloyl esterase